MRRSHDIATQAIVFGTLGFRASLEVTEHPRGAALCSELLPWLEKLNLGIQIEGYHRDIFTTRHRELSHESQAEAYWRGEAASVLGWAVRLLDKPDPTTSVDPGVFVERLKIPNSEARDLVLSAGLRPEIEIDDYCAFCLEVRHQFQASVLEEEGQAALNGIHHSRLSQLGLSEALHRRKEIDVEAKELAFAAPSLRGLYVVRALTAEWLLGADV